MVHGLPSTRAPRVENDCLSPHCNAHIDWLSGCTTQVVAVINVWPVTHTATVMIFPFDPTLLQGIFNTA